MYLSIWFVADALRLSFKCVLSKSISSLLWVHLKTIYSHSRKLLNSTLHFWATGVCIVALGASSSFIASSVCHFVSLRASSLCHPNASLPSRITWMWGRESFFQIVCSWRLCSSCKLPNTFLIYHSCALWALISFPKVDCMPCRHL